MKSNKLSTSGVKTLFSVVMILLIFGAADAEQKKKLPRSYGSLYLGMSVKEFKKLFDSVSLGRCVHCAEKELEADMCITEEDRKTTLCDNVSPARFKTAYIKFQLRELKPAKVICFFYDGVLYDIVLNNIGAKVKSIKESYISSLGKQTGDDAWDTGLAQIRWEDSSTMLTITYSTEYSERSVDDLIEIRYTDLRILRQIPNKKACGGDEQREGQ